MPVAPLAVKVTEPVPVVEIVGVKPTAFTMLPADAVRFTAPAAAVAATLFCN